jgi:hypothetical protein
MSTFGLVLLIVALAVVAFAVTRFLGIYRRWRGQRLVTCPDNQATVAVNVGAGQAAWRSFLSDSQIDLKSCTRWPEKQDCGQDCLSQIHESPEECLVRNIIVHWYEGRQCAVCGKTFGEISWHEHKPALMDESRKTVQWHEVPPEKLPEILETHQPVCWDCHVVESVYQQRPDVVVERPDRKTAY